MATRKSPRAWVWGALITTGLCPSPAARTPDLSFTLASYRPGDFDWKCRRSVDSAIQMGFTAVTIVPAYPFAVGQHLPHSMGDRESYAARISGWRSINPGELTRCLDYAWRAGLNIVYQPHVDSEISLKGTKEVVWRGQADFVPDQSYEKLVFGEFFDWLKTHREEIRESRGHRQVDMVMAAELEVSVARHPAEWNDAFHALNNRLWGLNLESQVKVGINLNGSPRETPAAGEKCEAYRATMRGIAHDGFIAPSFYGDWSHTADGSAQIEAQRRHLLDRMAMRDRPLFLRSVCNVSELEQAPFSVGEIGVGGDFSKGHRIEGPDHPLSRPAYQDKRLEFYRNLLSWAEEHPSQGDRAYHLNVWTVGVFDPVGVWPVPPESAPDPRVRQLFRDYTRRRCGPAAGPPAELVATGTCDEPRVAPAPLDARRYELRLPQDAADRTLNRE